VADAASHGRRQWIYRAAIQRAAVVFEPTPAFYQNAKAFSTKVPRGAFRCRTRDIHGTAGAGNTLAFFHWAPAPNFYEGPAGRPGSNSRWK